MKAGWEVRKLGEIGKVSMCKRVFKNQTSPTGEIPFYKIGTFGKEPDSYISIELYREYRDKYSFPNNGDILLSASGTIGRRVKYDGKPAYFQDSNIIWIDNDESLVLNEYLYHFYGFCEWQPSRGATISRLYTTNLKKIPIPIPPLPEQRAIVAKLDAAFAGITQARANIERNIQNAEELFQSKLNAVFAERGEGWEKYSLQDVSQSITDGDHQPPPKTNKGIPFITISNINKQSRKIDFSETYYVAEEYFNKIKDTRKPQKGDILYTVTGSFGIPVLLDFDKRFCFQRHIGLIKPNSLIDSKFLYYWILSPSAYSQACKLAKGTAQKTVSLKSLRSMFVFVPQRGEQEKIAKQLDEFSSEIEFIRSVLNNKIRALDDLQQSILQRAFSGQLTENEVAV
ncbi:restriction endonuclease subunit S [Phaeodactylibacter xiamenensis]|uniref:restriction endonuclease subunit S n=1 Tax=Phaeodactylibacter xiamenensis TaxID=1524460 RepID=UPI0024A91DAF|nr:restriction endonuclease subunit S [Phaeodactylibacter xiamenensis]